MTSQHETPTETIPFLSITRTCPACDGEGIVERMKKVVSDGQCYPEIYGITCPECDGQCTITEEVEE